MFSKQTVQEITAIADEFGLDPAALLAVAEVESGGQVFAVVNDKPEPLVRFEGHYFDARLTPEKKLKARAAGIASPVVGKIANPSTQAGRWRLIEKAAAIDAAAAYESVSWGLGQVMGAHWSELGYESVQELVNGARSGAAGQARLMARYIVQAKLADALTRTDWHAFARGYNGPDYRRYRYHSKIATAYEKYRADAAADMRPFVLRLGSTGLSVRKLQLELVTRGLLVEADGLFGRRTERAVREFQLKNGLVADGIAGPRTQAKLYARPAKPLAPPSKAGAMAALAKLFRAT